VVTYELLKTMQNGKNTEKVCAMCIVSLYPMPELEHIYISVLISVRKDFTRTESFH